MPGPSKRYCNEAFFSGGKDSNLDECGIGHQTHACRSVLVKAGSNLATWHNSDRAAKQMTAEVAQKYDAI